MTSSSLIFLCSVLLITPALASSQVLLTGYGFSPYDPRCARSCLRLFSSYKLSCTPTSNNGSHNHGKRPKTSPECYADDTSFLTSVAWCFSEKCADHDVPISKLQQLWEQSVTGTSKVSPKWPYSVALANVDPRPPMYQLTLSDTDLNQTSLIHPDKYMAMWNAMDNLEREALVESNSSLAIIFTSLGLPIVLTLLGYLPFMSKLIHSLNPYLIHPALITPYQVQPLPHHLGNAPTTGQALYILIFLTLNIILTSISYKTTHPNAWFPAQPSELSAYILYRTGTLGLVLLPILFLFSSRNNLLLYLSNWSHSTFLLLHRWVARVFALYVVVHSIVGLQAFSANSKEIWWIWGAVATVATVITVLFSGLYVRRGRYELFLVMHVVLAVVIVVGCWYHVTLWYGYAGIVWPDASWGYELWIYIGVAVWFVDRVWRVGRVLKAGVLRSEVTDLGGGYVRVDVPGVRWGSEPGRHVYAYFPTLRPLRPWENHPFSVVPTYMLRDMKAGSREGAVSESWSKDEEKNLAVPEVNTVPALDTSTSSAGVTLLIKKETGITKYLKADNRLLTLLDGPYGNNNTKEILRCDRVLLIAGGIGITGVLPWAYNHWNVKLAWSVSESARLLVEAVELSGVMAKDLRVGSRFDVKELIAEEVDAGWHRVGVVVSGPGGLCDDVRAAVVAAGRRGKTVFELEVDAYSW